MYISLKIKIWLFVNISVLSITLFTYFYFPYKEYHYHRKVYDKEIQYMAKTIATGVTIALSDGNFQGIKTSMEYAQADNRLKFIAMVQYDTLSAGADTPALNKKIFKVYPENTTIDFESTSDANVIVKQAPFTSDVMNGEIIIGFTTGEIVKNVNSLRQSILVAGMFILIISSVLSYFISRTITRPLHHLRDASHQIGTGNLNVNLNSKTNDELGDLVKAFDHMVKELAKSRKNVRKKRAQLMKVNAELKHLNDEKTNLMSIVSHDLRSPLNQIKGLISLIKLQNKTMDAETLELLIQVERSTDRMNGLIKKILNVEAAESPELNLVMEKVSLFHTLDHLLDHYSRVASEKGIKLFTKGSNNGFDVEADKHYTTLVFDNLLSNAIKFSPRNSNVFFNVMNERDNEFIRVEVQDEGPGISAEDQTRLFNKYQRLSARPTGDESSIGLGLSIVKKYVELMEGRVHYEDASPGSRFVVKLKKAIG